MLTICLNLAPKLRINVALYPLAHTPIWHEHRQADCTIIQWRWIKTKCLFSREHFEDYILRLQLSEGQSNYKHCCHHTLEPCTLPTPGIFGFDLILTTKSGDSPAQL
jgi:hypothetical protein